MKEIRKYSREQIENALAYWKQQINESSADDSVEVDEDVNNVLKVKRSADDARAAARSSTIEAGDPLYQIVEKHKKARAAGKKACASEMKGSDGDDSVRFEKVIISNSCVKNDMWVGAKDGVMVICAAIHMPTKKGKLARLFTGSIFKVGRNIGILALQGYVKEFLGKSFAKQVDKKHVFDGIDEEKDRVKYYVAFKLVNEATKMDEDDMPSI